MGWGGRVARWGFYALCGAVFLFLIVPVLVVVPMSFSSSRYLQFPPPGLSLRWYVNYLGDPEWTGATVRSLIVAALVTGICTVVGTLIYTHVLNRGPGAVRSPADRMFGA